MRKTKQGIIWGIICIVVCVLFVPVILFNLILTLKGSLDTDKLPSMFGYAPTAVVSGSMSPEFETNDLIFIKQTDPDSLQDEDIICFIDNERNFVTHRIDRIEVVNGVKHFYTKGDANNTADSDYIIAEQIQGVYVGKIDRLGGVVMFLQSPYGLILTVILLLVLYITGELIIECFETKRDNRRLNDENKELKDEIERLKALMGQDTRYIFEYAGAGETDDDLTVAAAVEFEDEDSLFDDIVNNVDDVKYKVEIVEEPEDTAEKVEEAPAEEFSFKVEIVEEPEDTAEKVEEAPAEEFNFKVEIVEEPEDTAEKIEEAPVEEIIIEENGEDKLDDADSEAYNAEIEIVIDDSSEDVFDGEDADDAINEEAEDSDGEIIVVENGVGIRYRYRRSFMSRLIQSGEVMQGLYTRLKNHILSYDGIKSRCNWGYEAFSHKRKPLVRLCMRGKSLYAYLALTDEEIEKLRVDEKVEYVTYSQVPAKIKIRGVVKLNRAIKAVDVICSRLGLDKGVAPEEAYLYPYETDEELLSRGLIKLVNGEAVPAELIKKTDDTPNEANNEANREADNAVKDNDADAEKNEAEASTLDGKLEEDGAAEVKKAGSADEASLIEETIAEENDAADIEEDGIADECSDLDGEEVIDGNGDGDFAELSEKLTNGSKKTVTLKPGMTLLVKRKRKMDHSESSDFGDIVVSGDAEPYTRAQYLALPRVKKKKVKTLIRLVDEHYFDTNKPSDVKKRKTADLWRNSTVPAKRPR